MKKNQSPYKAHLFICIKSRGGERKSCGDSTHPELKSMLKDEIKNRGWKPLVRVSESSCLGLCDAGPNIIIYPQKIWLSDVTPDDLPEILRIVEEIVQA